MIKKIKMVIAILLIVTITFNLLPDNIVSAKTKEVKVQQGQSEETQQNQDTIQQTSVEQTTEKPYILSEIEEKREPNTKYFLMSDKSITAATYNQPVRYRTKWQS